jgi:hypothetical protein
MSKFSPDSKGSVSEVAGKFRRIWEARNEP